MWGVAPAALYTFLFMAFDLDYATRRVANLMRRDNIDAEIKIWLDLSLKELCEEVHFPELRTVGSDIALSPGVYKYNQPSDFQHPGSLYYKCTSISPAYGWNLTPLPREFYKGETVDYERLLNSGNPIKGEPKHSFIDGDQYVIYPAWRDDGTTGVLIPTYYKEHIDWTSGEPTIKKRWRVYLLWLAYCWGMAFEEKADILKVKHWENEFDRTVLFIKRKVEKIEHTPIVMALPETGLEDADGIF